MMTLPEIISYIIIIAVMIYVCAVMYERTKEVIERLIKKWKKQ